jgi:hypothetical protein
MLDRVLVAMVETERANRYPPARQMGTKRAPSPSPCPTATLDFVLARTLARWQQADFRPAMVATMTKTGWRQMAPLPTPESAGTRSRRRRSH